MSTPSRLRHDPPEWTNTDFRSLVDAAPDAMMVVNQAWEVVVANTQAEKLFGYSREQLIGKSVESLISPRFRERHAQDREKFFGDPRVQPIGTWLELFALRSDGAEIPVEINLSPLTTESGTFVISSIRDATELRRVEELKKSEAVLRETRESEERFRLMADFAPVLIWMSGPDNLCTYFNKRWLDFTGRSLDQEKGNGWAEGVHPDDLQRCLDTYTQVFDRQEEFRMEYRLRRHDGEYRWIFDVGAPRFNADHSFAGYIGSCVDVTERRRAEKTVRESEERLRLAAQVGKMYAFDWDVATDLVVRSEEGSHILGLTGGPMSRTHQQVLASVHPDDRATFNTSIAECTPESPNTQISYRLLRPDGSVFWMERTGHAFFDEQGRMVRMIGMVADVTERKLAEEALSRVGGRLIEAHEEERSRIARDLHDDIGQRLALLVNDLDGLEKDLPDSAVEVRNRIHEQLNRVHEIASDTQAMSHQLHSSKLRLLGIVAAAKSFCQELSEQQKVEIDFTHADIPPAVPEEISLCLFRVMQEALHNAVKHSGVQRFEVELREAGLGFDPEGVKNNRGLGLVSMQERVNLVKGTFSIDSRPGRGTTIHARVPLSTRGESARAAGG